MVSTHSVGNIMGYWRHVVESLMMHTSNMGPVSATMMRCSYVVFYVVIKLFSSLSRNVSLPRQFSLYARNIYLELNCFLQFHPDRWIYLYIYRQVDLFIHL